MTVINPFDFFLEADADEFPFAYDADWLDEELRPYLQVAAGRARACRSSSTTMPRERDGTVDFLVDLNRYVHDAVGYIDPHGAGRADAATRRCSCGSGSCRDSAWLLVQMLAAPGTRRAVRLGLPDSTHARRQVARRARRAPTHDFTDLHAWTEVYLPGAGWIGLDPTSGLFAGEGHIPAGRHARPGSAPRRSPAASTTCETTFDFEMSVHADPRRSARHEAVHRRAVGTRSTRSATRSTTCCKRGDVRLTMGGEPTFVSIDDMDGAEWNIDGAGARQAAAGRRSVHAADATASPPGGCCTSARASGIPASRCRAGRWAATGARTASRSGSDPELIADDDVDYGCTRRRRASASSHALAERLGRRAASIVIAGLRRRLVLPVEGTPPAGQRRSARSRSWTIPRSARGWRRSSSRGSSKSVGYALPLRPRLAGPTSRAGRAARGSCAASTCSCCPAIRRWASGCRSIRCPGSRADDRPLLATRRSVRRPRAAAALSPMPTVAARHCDRRATVAAARPATAPARARRRPIATAVIGGIGDGGRRRRTMAGSHGGTNARRSHAARQPTCRRPVGRSASSCGRRCASSRATGGCTSSCRRSTQLEDYLDLVAAIEETAARARHAGA